MPSRNLLSSFPKLKSRWLVAAALLAALSAVGTPIYFWFNFQRSAATQLADSSFDAEPAVPDTIAALGYIQPKNSVITLSGSSALQHARVAEILVEEGEQVEEGEIIAVLDNLIQLQAAVEQAKQEVKIAQAELAQARAGQATPGSLAAQQAQVDTLAAQFEGEVASQEAEIRRLQAELETAQADYARFEQLHRQGAISALERDSRRLKVSTLQAQLREAEANRDEILSTYPNRIAEAEARVDQLKEVRPEDVLVAQAELESAIAAISEREADLDLAYVRAPMAGQILKIHTFAGESISEQGIFDLGQTQEMYVVAEVHETDIDQLQVGQAATATSSILPTPLAGTVEKIGLQINPKNVLNNDPALDVDNRVIEVQIRLDENSSQQATHLTNLQVDVEIDTHS
ncbi:MAG: ABC exporter membrane fusion protein [Phormidesmis sp.]